MPEKHVHLARADAPVPALVGCLGPEPGHVRALDRDAERSGVVPATLVDELSATPLLWVQPLDKQGKPDGDPLVCADGTRMAGPGQMIYWVASREAALTLDPWFVPVDDAIVGLVDEVRHYTQKELDR